MKNVFTLFMFLFIMGTLSAQSEKGRKPFWFEPIDSTRQKEILGEKNRSKTPSFYYELPAREKQIETKEKRQPVLKTRKKGTWRFGGSFGLTFSRGTSINISPQIGYQFNRYFTLGGGVGYNYYRYDEGWYENYKMHYIGLDVYVRLNPIPYLALQIQPEVKRYWGHIGSASYKGDIIPCVLAGAGGTIPLGRTGGISVMFYYDLVQNRYTPYGKNIFYSVGYSFGF
ncbi:hypothetical protein [Coprobacter tertius]|uniref:Outer membrane protein beta-barrel domain-containing protein n=1 Tax=Coprobacter tertius TaxID=2944915 RepID=A0ABT1MIQ3_9BACT|nr:hypothetical protein [Coprobacter tertius]MCP9612495.1 hypothetical protein [Coprobacter tertius]